MAIYSKNRKKRGGNGHLLPLYRAYGRGLCKMYLTPFLAFLFFVYNIPVLMRVSSKYSPGCIMSFSFGWFTKSSKSV